MLTEELVGHCELNNVPLTNISVWTHVDAIRCSITALLSFTQTLRRQEAKKTGRC